MLKLKKENIDKYQYDCEESKAEYFVTLGYKSDFDITNNFRRAVFEALLTKGFIFTDYSGNVITCDYVDVSLDFVGDSSFGPAFCMWRYEIQGIVREIEE